ncbi:hypothetical protein Tco_1046002, partial [Tanacetum coccineum]
MDDLHSIPTYICFRMSWYSGAEDEDDSTPNLLRRTTIGNGPPESILDWTQDSSALASQNANNQAISRKHWRLLQCQNAHPNHSHVHRAEHRGKKLPQSLEEPTSDEVLRELCDKNYHRQLPLIAEKMQKEKEQQDKLNAVKARLLYGDESGRNPRNHEESHYSESKTPTARTELRRRHGSKHSRSPSPIAN